MTAMTMTVIIFMFHAS